MDAIKAARELGKAIQADECYKAYYAAKEINDNDGVLQDLIGEFNLLKQNLSVEMNKSDKSGDKVKEYNQKAQEVYSRIMENESMARFTEAKYAMDRLIKEVSGIISLCCDGEDPDVCQVESGCAGGSCEGCSGCG